MGSKVCYLFVIFWITRKGRFSSSSVPDPCPNIQPMTQVTNMCQTGLAVEQIGELQYGNKNFDHVTLRARIQEDNCTCLLFIENQSFSSFQMYIEPYGMLQSSAPKETECGLELYLSIYQTETLKPGPIMLPIKCTSGQIGSSFSLSRNSVLSFTSKVRSGNFTRGYCIDIHRVHVNGQNGTLKIVCDVPGRIPPMNLTTTQSPDHSSSTKKDESTLYIAIGMSAGVLLILAVVLVNIFYRRKLSDKSKKTLETSKTDTTHTHEQDDPDYNGLKNNMLYVSADQQDVLEGDYHTVDNNQEPIHQNVSDHDMNYSTVDDVACTSFNTVPTHEVVKNVHKGLGYKNFEKKEITKREQNISQEGNGNTYAVVDKRRFIGHDSNQKAALSPVYAVVDKTGKLKIENKQS